MNLMNLPVDIFAHKIFPDIGVTSTVLMTGISKKMYENKNKMFSHLIKNDTFLHTFTTIYKFDLIHALSNSSISYKLFDELYEYIQYGSNISRGGHIIIKKENTTQEQINNTFNVLKILKMSINFKNQDIKHRRKCSIMITNILKKYFNNMFFARNTTCRFYVSFMLHLNETSWENIDINLYNICEDLNLMSNDKTSEVFQKNLHNMSKIIVTRKKDNVVATTELINKIFVDPTQPLKVYIYANYILFRYMNHLFKENIQFEIINNSQFMESSLNRLSIYEEIVDNSNFEEIANASVYLKNMIDIEVNQYKINIIENFD